MKPILAFTVSAAIGASLAITAFAAQPPASAPTPAPVAPNPPPIVEGAHWHHIHINATNPAQAVEFYPRHFKAQKAKFDGRRDAVFTQKSWMLFTQVNAPPSSKLNTGIWHIGWGSQKPKEEYVRQQGLGAKFFTPLTDISTGLNGFQPDSFYFMYVEGPDRELIELNTAQHTNFGHMHMFSADPVAAGDWWIRTFGVRGRLSTPQTNRAPRMSKTGLQVGPSASINFDNVNMIIYPVEYAKKAYPEDWAGVSEIQSTRGSVNDHVGVSVPDLDKALAALRAAGVKVTLEPRTASDNVRYFFIEGPDKVAIEVIEDKSPQPTPADPVGPL